MITGGFSLSNELKNLGRDGCGVSVALTALGTNRGKVMRAFCTHCTSGVSFFLGYNLPRILTTVSEEDVRALIVPATLVGPS